MVGPREGYPDEGYYFQATSHDIAIEHLFLKAFLCLDHFCQLSYILYTQSHQIRPVRA